MSSILGSGDGPLGGPGGLVWLSSSVFDSASGSTLISSGAGKAFVGVECVGIGELVGVCRALWFCIFAAACAA